MLREDNDVCTRGSRRIGFGPVPHRSPTSRAGPLSSQSYITLEEDTELGLSDLTSLREYDE
jgi:hypothetical protein